jgi:alpha-glucoside transport system substrate-binding protein
MTAHTKRYRSRNQLVLAMGITAGLALAGCASASDSSSGGAGASTPAASADLPAALVDSAVAAAKTAAGDEKLGGTLKILGVTSGDEATALTDAMAPFTTATGTKIEYTGSQDWSTVLATGIESNNLPDLVDAQGAGSVHTYAKRGLFLGLNDIIGADTLSANFSQGLVDAASVDGDTYGIWGETDAFMVWYNTATYDGPTDAASYAELNDWATAQAATGIAPWCMALEAGAGTGFPAESWIENMFLKMWGPEKLTAWANGDIAFNSDEVTATFQRFADVAGSNTMVNGGPQSVVSTSFVDYTKGMFSDPQECQLSLWGNYAAALTQSTYPDVKVPGDLNFFTIPGDTAEADTAQNTAGHVMSALKANDSPASRAFMKYWASTEAQSLIAASGRWSVGNKNIDLDTYPNATMRASAELLNNASTVVTGPTSVMPSAVVAAWDKAMIAIAQDPSSLDDQLDSIQAVADTAK